MKSLKIVGFVVVFIALSLTGLASAQRLATFTGSAHDTSDTQITEAFDVPTKDWEIDWSYIHDSQYPQYSGIYIYIFPKGETVKYSDMLTLGEGLNGSVETSGVQFEHKGNGEYYLKIVSANVENYQFVMIQGQADPTSTLTPTPTVPEYSAYTVLIVIVAFVSLASIMLFKQRKN